MRHLHSTETIQSANRTSQIAASALSDQRGSSAFTGRTPSGRLDFSSTALTVMLPIVGRGQTMDGMLT